MSETRGDGSSKKLEGADFKKWARRDTWHIAEGAMLILGLEPFEIKTDWWPPRCPAPGFVDIYETARTSRGLAAKGEGGSPPDFLAWAHDKEYRVPRKLEEAVNQFHPKAEGSRRVTPLAQSGPGKAMKPNCCDTWPPLPITGGRTMIQATRQPRPPIKR